MPYSVVNNHPDCEGFAVIKDSTREVIGCHKTKEQAQDQLTAINISEFGTREVIATPNIEQARKILESLRRLDIQ